MGAYIELGPSAVELLHTTILIETNESVGTGFLFKSNEAEPHSIFLVTNKHVIENSTKGTLRMPRVGGDPITVTIDDFETHWLGHPGSDVDIAVLPVGWMLSELSNNGIQLDVKYIQESLIPDRDLLQQIGPFAEVLFVGYPNGLIDSVSLQPIVRRGMLASRPEIDYDGTPTVLIDASVFPGSSGSPVFILHSSPMFFGNNQISFAKRMYFLGVIASVMIRREVGTVSFESIPTALGMISETQQMIDIGVVFRSEEVARTCYEHHNTVLDTMSNGASYVPTIKT